MTISTTTTTTNQQVRPRHFQQQLQQESFSRSFNNNLSGAVSAIASLGTVPTTVLRQNLCNGDYLMHSKRQSFASLASFQQALTSGVASTRCNIQKGSTTSAEENELCDNSDENNNDKQETLRNNNEKTTSCTTTTTTTNPIKKYGFNVATEIDKMDKRSKTIFEVYIN